MTLDLITSCGNVNFFWSTNMYLLYSWQNMLFNNKISCSGNLILIITMFIQITYYIMHEKQIFSEYYIQNQRKEKLNKNEKYYSVITINNKFDTKFREINTVLSIPTKLHEVRHHYDLTRKYKREVTFLRTHFSVIPRHWPQYMDSWLARFCILVNACHRKYIGGHFTPVKTFDRYTDFYTYQCMKCNRWQVFSFKFHENSEKKK